MKSTKAAVVLTPTIQDIVIASLTNHNDIEFQEVLKHVKSYYPASKFSKACFYWYRKLTNAYGITEPKINHPASIR